jgi:iron complex outermembrane receptor protein
MVSYLASPTPRRCLNLLPITCTIATLAWTSPVWSADAASEESASGGARIEEIVVTARKQAESQQDVPISLNALSDADLHKSTVLSIADLQANAPGLVVSASSKGGAPSLGIRVAHTQNGQEGTGITAYIDDVPMHSTFVVANMMYDMESVSVLKGPQGTLFGTNSTGGAFIFSPKKPTDNFEGYGEVGFGDWGRQQYQAMLNVPLGDVLQIRVAGDIVRRDGFVDNLAPVNGNDKMASDEHESARIIARFTPTSTFTNDLMGNYFHEDGQPNQAIPVFFSNPFLTAPVTNTSGCGILCGPFGLGETGAGVTLYGNNHTVSLGPNAATPNNIAPTWKKIEIWGLTNTTKWDISDNVSFKNVLAYQDERLDTAEDNDGTSLMLVNGRSIYNTKLWTEEASVNLQTDDKRLRFVGGVFYSDSKPDQIDNYQLVGLIDTSFIQFLPAPGAGLFPFPVISQNSYERELQSTALYSQVSYDVTDQLTATFGFRYNWDKGTYHVHLRGGTGNGNAALGVAAAQFDPTFGDVVFPCREVAQAGYVGADLVNCTAQLDAEWSAPSWTFSLQQQFAAQSMVYFTARAGYQGGGFNNEISNVDLQVYKPETVIDFETGVKSDWTAWGRPIRTNVSAFYGQYNDIQRNQNGSYTSGAQFSAVFNAGAATYYGSDLEVTFYPTESLELALAYNLLKTSYDTFVIPAIPNGAPPFDAPQDLSGSPLAYAPENQLSVQATLNWPWLSSLGEFATTLGYYWTDQIYFNDVPTAGFEKYDVAPSYSLVNLSQDWRGVLGTKLDATIWAKNLLDEEAMIGVGGNNQLLTFGYATRTYAAPRQFGINLRYSF